MVPHCLTKGLHLHMDGIALSSNLSGLPTPISAHFLLQYPLALNHLCPLSYSHSDVLCPTQCVSEEQTATTGKHQRCITEFLHCPETKNAEEQCQTLRPNVRTYRCRGTCGTFAGKRHPKALGKRLQFEQERVEHQEKKETMRRSTCEQQLYRDFVKAMLPLESHGTGPERLRSVAAKWKAQQPRVHQLAQENRSVF